MSGTTNSWNRRRVRVCSTQHKNERLDCWVSDVIMKIADELRRYLFRRMGIFASIGDLDVIWDR